ncbi:MAG: alpha/beta hydrolase [Micropepsaceae bacterium]
MKDFKIPMWFVRLFAILMSIPVFLQICSHAKSDDSTAPRITVSVEGKGPDIVMIPGLASSAEVWRGEANRLKAVYRVHLVQVAGFAGTPVGGNVQTPLLLPIQDEIVAYISTQHLNHPVLVGHSMGGLLSMMIAESHPEVIGNVLIVDSLPFFGLLSNPQATVEGVMPIARQFRDQVIAQGQDAYAQGQLRTMSMLIKSNGPEAQAALAAAQSSDHKVVAQALFEDWTTDLRSRLGSMTMKVAVLYPYDTSMGIPQSAVDGIYNNAFAGLPNKQIIRIDGSYHFIQIDQPDRFHEEVMKFLALK